MIACRRVSDIGFPLASISPSLPISSERHDHAVGFYETDRFLVDLVVDFVSPALTHDETAFVIASEQHHRMLMDALAPRHPDIEVARRDGQLVLVDAHATRQRLITTAGALDVDRFRAVTGELFAHATQRNRPVRIFGYMVALFWGEGNVTAALELEDQWNELAALQEFELMCAYPMRNFAVAGSEAAFHTVCQRHSAIANEGYIRLGDDVDDGLGSASPVVMLQREEPDRHA